VRHGVRRRLQAFFVPTCSIRSPCDPDHAPSPGAPPPAEIPLPLTSPSAAVKFVDVALKRGRLARIAFVPTQIDFSETVAGCFSRASELGIETRRSGCRSGAAPRTDGAPALTCPPSKTAHRARSHIADQSYSTCRTRPPSLNERSMPRFSACPAATTTATDLGEAICRKPAWSDRLAALSLARRSPAACRPE